MHSIYAARNIRFIGSALLSNCFITYTGKVSVYSKMGEIPELNDMKTRGVVSPFMRCIEMFIRRDRVKSVNNDTKEVERERFVLDGSAGGYASGRMINHWG